MNCRRVEGLLSKQLDGHLPEHDAAEVTAHLRDCPACCRLQEELRVVGTDVRRLAGLPMSPGIERRVAERWLRERERRDERPRALPRAAAAFGSSWARRGLGPLAAAASVLVVICLTWVGGRLPSRGAGGQVVVRPSPPAPLPATGRGEATRGGSSAPPRTVLGEGPGVRAGSAPGVSAPHSANPRRRAAHSGPAGATGQSLAAADDLRLLNGDSATEAPTWEARPRDKWEAIEQRVRRIVRPADDFVQIPFPRIASASERQIARAVASYQREAAVVDPRLDRAVTLAQKGTALSDLCEMLRVETGIDLKAGPSVADEKVTLFCEKTPLRQVMRQLSRPFGYTWLRSRQGMGDRSWGLGKEEPSRTPAPNSQPPTPDYRYELAQDLKSQLLEEELRNRDRNEALLALDREIQQFRPYLDLSPDRALEKAKSAPPAEKKLLERLAGLGWGVAQLYFRLPPEQLNRLRAGQALEFHQEPGQGELPLPQEMAANVLSSLRERRLLVNGDGVFWGHAGQMANAVPPSQVEGAHPLVHVQVVQSELGQYTLEGYPGLTLEHPDCVLLTSDDARALGPLATGISPSAQRPNNAAANARFAGDPALQRRVASLQGVGRRVSGVVGSGPTPDPPAERVPGRPTPQNVTSADVLEALHRATGMPVVADYYTRLYPSAMVSCENQRLYDALNRLADAMRLRWREEGEWLQFRSASYFHDRLKEVPNRLLAHWAAARRQRGDLALEELLEIAGLSDAQLDASGTAEGARELYGLQEWDLARNSKLRPHWRFLATLSPAQRQEAATASGLSFTRMTLPQQQQFLRLALGADGESPAMGLQELAATLKIDYSVPGWFQWPARGAPDPSFPDSIQQRPSVRERTRAAALAAARKLDPNVTAAAVVPTALDGVVIYTVGTASTHHAVRVVSTSQSLFMTD
jgi:putative zinc finger protein